MASIRKEIDIAAPAAEVWDVVRDLGAIHTRFVRGFVIDTKLEEGSRIVTFETGLVVQELFVDLDDEARRFAYAVRSETMTHHNASMQVFPEGPQSCRLVWVTDLLPDEAAGPIGAMIERGSTIIRATLDRQTAAD
ncbi:SRPBCC family protein [Parvibaculum sedimenti]|uniref:SRPBCC family protein n=1 Tax=Parvibaculum sedimenti TaxID=2608632 RepID=A0A6N6VL14_9HYPH|nr:SRPBCC family protein [Parvibaculum sedimenti]KAB7740713.1 SRPBCC family protein [Parvibaculum sedimenti]